MPTPEEIRAMPDADLAAEFEAFPSATLTISDQDLPAALLSYAAARRANAEWLAAQAIANREASIARLAGRAAVGGMPITPTTADERNGWVD